MKVSEGGQECLRGVDGKQLGHCLDKETFLPCLLYAR